MIHVEAQAFYKHLVKRELCNYCGKKRASSRRSIDHIHPQDSGGLSVWFNYASACTKCNSDKSNKTLLEYLLVGGKGERHIPPRIVMPLEDLSMIPKGWEYPLHTLMGINRKQVKVPYCKFWGAKLRKEFRPAKKKKVST